MARPWAVIRFSSSSAESRFKFDRISRIGRQLPDRLVQRLMHFQGILDGLENLIPQAPGPAILKELRLPGQIEQWHRVAFSRQAVRPQTEPFPGIRKCRPLVMARGAGLGVIY